MRRVARYLVSFTLLLWAGTHRASAGTFTVSSTNDAGPGTLRQAINDANTNSGPDTIQFSLPANTRTISPPAPLPTIPEPVTRDGSPQPGFSNAPLTKPSGQLAGSFASAPKITAGSSTIRSLIINRFSGHGIEIAN